MHSGFSVNGGAKHSEESSHCAQEQMSNTFACRGRRIAWLQSLFAEKKQPSTHCPCIWWQPCVADTESTADNIKLSFNLSRAERNRRVVASKVRDIKAVWQASNSSGYTTLQASVQRTRKTTDTTARIKHNSYLWGRHGRTRPWCRGNMIQPYDASKSPFFSRRGSGSFPARAQANPDAVGEPSA